MSTLTIKTFCLGDWMTNCYVVHTRGGSNCWIIDCGFEPQSMLDYIGSHELHPQQVILTHAHVDHIAGLETLRTAWPNVPILVHPAEQSALTDPIGNLSAALAEPVIAPAATGTIDSSGQLKLADTAFEVRHTPGHSPGGITLYSANEQVAFVGDVLFAGSIGRHDFPGCSLGQLIKSIRRQLMTLPDETRVFPGHGMETSIGRERMENPFIPNS